MAQIVGVSSLDFAYKGYQYPIPPSWKYAVRIQDQINWLLQAVLALDENGVSVDELTEAITDAIEQVTQGYRGEDAELARYIDRLIGAIEERVAQFEDRNAVFRNPVTGMRDYGYVVAKQMYDMLRVHAMTWDELKNTGKTWDALKADGHSWFEIDLFSDTYYGTGDPRAKFTPTENIDVATPGYIDMGEEDASLARSWGEMAQFGFLTRKAE